MPPMPKHADERLGKRGKNAPGMTKLDADGGRRAPVLPGAKDMLPSTRRWWATVWASPMSALYLDADVPALHRLARLIEVDAKGQADGATRSEIRQLEDRFGLSPGARRRLQWEVEQKAKAAAAPVAPSRWASMRVVDPAAPLADSA